MSNETIQPSPPRRQLLIEKSLNRHDSIHRHVFAPGGCIWMVEVGQCIIRQWFYIGVEFGRFKFCYIRKGKNDYLNVTSFDAMRLEMYLDTNSTSTSFLHGQEVSVHSSFRDAEKLLYEFAIPFRIAYLDESVKSKNIKSSKKVQARIKLIELQKLLKKWGVKKDVVPVLPPSSVPIAVAISGDIKTEFDVVLKSMPLGNTVQVIKLLSTIKKISLRDAKDLLIRMPFAIEERITAERANGLIESFRALGAVTDIR